MKFVTKKSVFSMCMAVAVMLTSVFMPQNTLQVWADEDGYIEDEHIHGNVEKFDGVEPTCTTNGHKAYYKCDCGEYFLDPSCIYHLGNYSQVQHWLNTSGFGLLEKTGHNLSYELSEDQGVLIAICSACEGSVTLSLTASDRTYSGSENNASISETQKSAWKAFVGADAPSINYEYKATSEGTYATAANIMDTGYYRASITCGGKTAYKEYQVSKADYSGTTSVNINLKNTPGSTASVTLPSIPEGARFVEINNSDYSEYFSVGGISSGGTCTITAEDGITSATETMIFIVSVSSSKNYNEYSITVNVTPVDKVIEDNPPSDDSGNDNSSDDDSSDDDSSVNVSPANVSTGNKTSGGAATSAITPGTRTETEKVIGKTDSSVNKIATNGVGVNNQKREDDQTKEILNSVGITLAKGDSIIASSNKKTADGSTEKQVRIKSSDGSTTESKVTEYTDGTVKEYKRVESADGKVTERATVTEADGSVKTNVRVVEEDGSKCVDVTNTSADGKEETKVSVAYEADGTVANAVVEVVKEVEGKKLVVSMSDLKEMTSETGAGKKNTTVTLIAKDEDGDKKYSVSIEPKNLSKKTLGVYAIDEKGNLVTVNPENNYAKVSKNGDLSLNISGNGEFTLLNSMQAFKTDISILKTVKPEQKTVEVSEAEKTEFKLSSDCNQKNIAAITYETKNGNVKVDKDGKITALSHGTSTVTSIVTLNNGKTKTVKMKVKVK